MSKKKADKATKMLLDANQASGIDPTMLSASWQGRICVIDVAKSYVAKKLGFEKNGEYAIKVR